MPAPGKLKKDCAQTCNNMALNFKTQLIFRLPTVLLSCLAVGTELLNTIARSIKHSLHQEHTQYKRGVAGVDNVHIATLWTLTFKYF